MVRQDEILATQIYYKMGEWHTLLIHQIFFNFKFPPPPTWGFKLRHTFGQSAVFVITLVVLSGNKVATITWILVSCKWYHAGKCDGEWRKREAENLKSAVQSTIIKSQNPSNCTAAKKLVCHQNHEVCGLGCQLNHLAYCLITALATGRVLVIIEDQGMPHYGNITVTQFFMPVSKTCMQFEGVYSLTVLDFYIHQILHVSNTCTQTHALKHSRMHNWFSIAYFTYLLFLQAYYIPYFRSFQQNLGR